MHVSRDVYELRSHLRNGGPKPRTTHDMEVNMIEVLDHTIFIMKNQSTEFCDLFQPSNPVTFKIMIVL